MSTKIQFKMQHLNSLSAMTFVDDAEIHDHFIHVYKRTHNVESDDLANDFYARESLYFKQLISSAKDVRECTMFSLYACFMDIIVNGLTFDPAAKLLHIEARSFNTAAYNAPPVWEKRARNVIDSPGELALRLRYGHIKYVDDPVIVYAEDFWEPGYKEEGNRYCIYKAKIPRTDKKIIGSFMKIVRNDGSFDMPWFTEENFSEWAAASKKANKDKPANELYTSGEGGQMNIGFLKTKTIKHSFKTYPKIKVIGTNTELEDAEYAANIEEPNSQPPATNNSQQNSTKSQVIPPTNGNNYSDDDFANKTNKQENNIHVDDDDF